MQPNFDDIKVEPSIEQVRKKRIKIIVTAVIVLLLVVVLAVTAALLVKTYVVTTYVVDGISMYPTLDGGSGAIDDNERTNGELLYLNRIAKIKRGDIVVITPKWDGLKDANGNYRTLVKRVIAVGGDSIYISGGAVYLNGQLLSEPYLNKDPNMDDMPALTVPEGQVFIMGDNRAHSADSRVYGTASLDDVVGKCFLVKGLDGKLRRVK